MKNISTFLLESQTINEGGMSGHMAHPIDYDEFMQDDLIDLVTKLFKGEITDITEKIDGTNIQATMNQEGEVVFIRNKGDLNSDKGGMSITDMAEKWKDKPSVAQTFITAGETITKVFNKIGKDFFNPDQETRLVINCECVIEGVTNIMPYSAAQVDFHNIWIYKKAMVGWQNDSVTKDGLDKLAKASEGIEGAQITPKVIIGITKDSNKLIDKYTKEIQRLFNNQNITIKEYKLNRFNQYLKENSYNWILDDVKGYSALFERWFNADKSMNLRELKKLYSDHVDELMQLDKTGYKDIVSSCIEPLDDLFLGIGYDIIGLCKGLLNQDNNEKVIHHLNDELSKTIKQVKAEGSATAQSKLAKQLKRLSKLNNNISSAEGIVFIYKGKLMKLTGAFAPLNQILGSIKFSK